MIYQIVNTKTNLVLFKADIYVGPNSIICKKVLSIDLNEFKKTQEISSIIKEPILEEDLCDYIAYFLEQRCQYPCSYDFDNYAMELLKVKERKYLFGRMNDYSCAIGIIEGFTSNYDSYKGFPLYDEILSFIIYDPNLYRTYLLRKDGTCT